MATFRRDDLFDNDETVTLPSHAKINHNRKETVGQVKIYQDHRPRAETVALIKTAIRDAGKPLTFNSIARALQRSTSPHLRKIITDLVNAGELLESVDVPNNERMVRYWYSLPS